ncbi:MAG TPA: 30S ribosome-binding factor RbfA [Egibacteraceae bacterium]|nr:30S ribosome-binding factor RbfA [Actinomycetota bacterium]HWB70972.1 30S ribosome-binding factor RbfA [Egibacteraceae bacterium]
MSYRMRRVNEAVKEVLAELLPDLKDPRVGFVTLTDVRTSADLRAAEVFYTVLPADEESLAATAAGLRSATPLLRRELGARLRLRYVPELRFSHDPLPAHSRRIEQLLAEDATGDRPDAAGGGAHDERRR